MSQHEVKLVTEGMNFPAQRFMKSKILAQPLQPFHNINGGEISFLVHNTLCLSPKIVGGIYTTKIYYTCIFRIGNDRLYSTILGLHTKNSIFRLFIYERKLDKGDVNVDKRIHHNYEEKKKGKDGEKN
ncbi:hypothetical protein ACJX0J_032611 [Zea mays]